MQWCLQDVYTNISLGALPAIVHISFPVSWPCFHVTVCLFVCLTALTSLCSLVPTLYRFLPVHRRSDRSVDRYEWFICLQTIHIQHDSPPSENRCNRHVSQCIVTMYVCLSIISCKNNCNNKIEVNFTFFNLCL